MARTPSAVLSKADLKAAIVSAKAGLNVAKAEIKAFDKAQAVAAKDAAKKSKELGKALAAAQKALDKLVPPKA